MPITLPSHPSEIPAVLSLWYNNFTTNTHHAFKSLTVKDAIRLVIVIGAYALIIRPLLLKLGARIQNQQHERDAAEGLGPDGATPIDPLTGRPKEKFAIPGVDSESDEEDEDKLDPVKGEWGRTARTRQRKVVRRALELKEQLGEEDDIDDIREFLED
ncbi:DUF1531-domain-containing protein [Microthyrium microscopicum]|uniref:DUF1531-domain-containing protein n=1 Tax=Microthyrium microscopicum TaxID=703497 RepID=A0A6A6UC37_9PEZI|nr:DUF1531-domain-containing protein [Microthyrium microscopicum]